MNYLMTYLTTHPTAWPGLSIHLNQKYLALSKIPSRVPNPYGVTRETLREGNISYQDSEAWSVLAMHLVFYSD